MFSVKYLLPLRLYCKILCDCNTDVLILLPVTLFERAFHQRILQHLEFLLPCKNFPSLHFPRLAFYLTVSTSCRSILRKCLGTHILSPIPSTSTCMKLPHSQQKTGSLRLQQRIKTLLIYL